MPRRQLTRCLVFAAVGLAITGCQPKKTFAPTHPVGGTVVLDGKPLAEGVIAFVTPETGDLQSFPIKDGKYAGQARAGLRRVEIRAYPPSKSPPSPMDPPPQNFLPDRYNVASTLTAEVKPDGPNTFDFDLKSK